MQSEEAIKIHGRTIGSTRRGNGKRRPCRIVGAFAERHDHVQTIDRAALKDRDEDATMSVGGSDRSREKRGSESETHQRESAIL
jgi:hypothetical protein